MVQTGGKIFIMSSILEKLDIIRLEENTPITSFDCGDFDLKTI